MIMLGMKFFTQQKAPLRELVLGTRGWDAWVSCLVTFRDFCQCMDVLA